MTLTFTRSKALLTLMATLLAYRPSTWATASREQDIILQLTPGHTLRFSYQAYSRRWQVTSQERHFPSCTRQQTHEVYTTQPELLPKLIQQPCNLHWLPHPTQADKTVLYVGPLGLPAGMPSKRAVRRAQKDLQKILEEAEKSDKTEALKLALQEADPSEDFYEVYHKLFSKDSDLISEKLGISSIFSFTVGGLQSLPDYPKDFMSPYQQLNQKLETFSRSYIQGISDTEVLDGIKKKIKDIQDEAFVLVEQVGNSQIGKFYNKSEDLLEFVETRIKLLNSITGLGSGGSTSQKLINDLQTRIGRSKLSSEDIENFLKELEDIRKSAKKDEDENVEKQLKSIEELLRDMRFKNRVNSEIVAISLRKAEPARQYERVPTNDDGHCAFNGTGMGLIDLLLSGAICLHSDHHQGFITLFAKQAGCEPNPQAILAYIKEHKSELDKEPRKRRVNLERLMATALRKLAVTQYTNKNRDELFKRGLVNELHRFLDGVYGYITFREREHPYLYKKFEGFRLKSKEERERFEKDTEVLGQGKPFKEGTVMRELHTWWNEEGFDMYKLAIGEGQNGVAVWGSDFDITPLGDYFGVNLFNLHASSSRQKDAPIVPMHLNKTSLSKIEDEKGPRYEDEYEDRPAIVLHNPRGIHWTYFRAVKTDIKDPKPSSDAPNLGQNQGEQHDSQALVHLNKELNDSIKSEDLFKVEQIQEKAKKIRDKDPQNKDQAQKIIDRVQDYLSKKYAD